MQSMLEDVANIITSNNATVDQAFTAVGTPEEDCRIQLDRNLYMVKYNPRNLHLRFSGDELTIAQIICYSYGGAWIAFGTEYDILFDAMLVTMPRAGLVVSYKPKISTEMMNKETKEIFSKYERLFMRTVKNTMGKIIKIKCTDMDYLFNLYKGLLDNYAIHLG